MSNTYESIGQKVLRHIKGGEFNLATIRGGVDFIGQYMSSRDVLSTTLEREYVDNNYEGIDGVTVHQYFLRKPDRTLYDVYNQPITIVEFPVDSKLGIFLADNTDPSRWVGEFFLNIPTSIGEFTGPTFIQSEGLPNNGFYSSEDPELIVQFRDTNPSGGRRGAIAQREDGEVELIDDKRKWEIVRSGFVGYKYVVGTTTYVTSEDDLSRDEIYSVVDRSRVSYLIQYIDANKNKRLAHLTIKLPVPRVLSRECIFRFANDVGAERFFAVELELLGANCALRKGDEAVFISPGLGGERRDHYVIFRGESLSVQRRD